MKRLLLAILLYALFLVHLLIAPWGPDLVLLFVLAIAVHETRLAATAGGIIGGLLLDIASPASLGINTLVYGIVSYATAVLHDIITRGRFYIAALALLALCVKYLAQLLIGSGAAGVGPVLVSSATTLALAVPVEWAVARLYRPR